MGECGDAQREDRTNKTEKVGDVAVKNSWALQVLLEKLIMLKVSYKVTIAQWSVNSADDPRTEFIELETSHSLIASNDVCRISVYALPAPQSGLLEQAGAAAAGELGVGGEEESLSVQVRGNNIKTGDPISIHLTAGDVSEKVISAEVQSFHSSLGQTQITGRTGMQKLANTRLNQVYQNQSLQQIVNDLAGQADVTIGDIETGSTYPYFVVHESKSLLKHVREMAAREGMDVYFDTENKLTLKKFNKSSADHTFTFGINILDLRLFNRQPVSEHVMVYGESPASNQGSDTWHWVAKDISPFQGEVGQGTKTLAIAGRAIRTKDAADTCAAAKLGAIIDGSTVGRLKVLGNPTVKLGDAIEIKGVERPEMNGLFKVTSVRHVLSKQEGYLTHIGLGGIEGARSAKALMSSAPESSKGAIGL